MSRRIKTFIIIEICIIAALLIHVLKSPYFLLLLAFAVTFSVLSQKITFLRPVSAVLWIFLTVMLLTAGWFWLALLFPILVGISFWKKQGQGEFNYDPQNYPDRDNAKDITRANGNDVIDLYDIKFRPEGNNLNIKKSAGNTKIIVPEDVAIALEITVHNGVVKIFDEEAEINPSNLRHFSDVAQGTQKRIRIKIQVETGNVEVVKG
ncbi:LiaF domain-containing protein [Lactococcus garvieae]|jgi:predicted membrane protein|uniref:LiaF domain-containing protein n=1 Tax=Lactococcus garvieae TaxID=1363 RepID=UPI0018D78F9D|nr:LiaF domain-containing protein [Lactococcus garvieae]QPS71435.1 hypothetical protein I6G50_01885 [Lactococcus garvieae]